MNAHGPAAGTPALELVEVSPFDLDELVAASLALYVDEGVAPPPAVNLRVSLHRRLRGDARALLFRSARDAPTLAFALTSREGERARIEQFRVEPSARRAGWGRRCIRALLEGPLADAAEVRVRVLEDNAAGRAFWAALGFGAGRLRLEVLPRP